MCKHTYKTIEIENNIEKEKRCEWEDFFQNLPSFNFDSKIKFLDLPHDDAGLCLLHSTDIDWKRKQNFVERFKELCINWEKVAEENQEYGLSFHECHLVGGESEFKYDFEDEPSYTMNFENFLLKNHILFFDCVFYDSIRIEKALFKKGITIDNCLFKSDIDIMNVFVGDDITLSPNNIYETNVGLTNLRLIGKFDCIKNTFKGRFDFDSIDCLSEVYIDSSIFATREEYVNFTAYFHEGLSLRSNIANCVVTISETTFEKDTLFYDNRFNSEFHLEYPAIYGNIAFVGTDKNLLFNPHSIIDLSTESFNKSGRLIFDYCNILNLGNEFIAQIRELENYQLVTIRDTCKIDRLVIVREYNYSYINDYIITDFSNLIVRFFKHYFSINLNVEILRDIQNGKIKIIYKTSDKIEEKEFNSRLSGINEKFDTFSQHKFSDIANYPDKDFSFTYQSIIHRILEAYKNDRISQEEIFSILTFQNTIELSNSFNVIVNKINTENVNLLAENMHFNGNIQTFTNSTFNENKK